DPAAAALLDPAGAAAELRGPGADRAAGAQPQDSLRPVALVAQTLRPAVRGRRPALAELQVADRAGLAGGAVAGRLRDAGAGGCGVQAAALPLCFAARRIPAHARGPGRGFGAARARAGGPGR